MRSMNTLEERGFTVIELNADEIKGFLGERLSKKRYKHSLNVAAAAKKLAEINGADPEKCYITGLLHDICKEISAEEQLELLKRSGFEVSQIELMAPKTHHAVAGAQFVREHYRIDDPEILTPMRWHTVGKGGMNIYEQILYMADLISDERSYDGAEELRELTYRDLKRGLYEAFKFMVVDKVDGKKLIPHSTVDAYNEYTALELARKDRV